MPLEPPHPRFWWWPEVGGGVSVDMLSVWRKGCPGEEERGGDMLYLAMVPSLKMMTRSVQTPLSWDIRGWPEAGLSMLSEKWQKNTVIYQSLELTICFPPFSMMSLFLLLWLQSMEDFTLIREPCNSDKHQNLRMTSLKKRRRNLQRLERYLFLNFRSTFFFFFTWLYKKISRWLARMSAGLRWLRSLTERHEPCWSWQVTSRAVNLEVSTPVSQQAQ